MIGFVGGIVSSCWMDYRGEGKGRPMYVLDGVKERGFCVEIGKEFSLYPNFSLLLQVPRLCDNYELN